MVPTSFFPDEECCSFPDEARRSLTAASAELAREGEVQGLR